MHDTHHTQLRYSLLSNQGPSQPLRTNSTVLTCKSENTIDVGLLVIRRAIHRSWSSSMVLCVNSAGFCPNCTEASCLSRIPTLTGPAFWVRVDETENVEVCTVPWMLMRVMMMVGYMPCVCRSESRFVCVLVTR